MNSLIKSSVVGVWFATSFLAFQPAQAQRLLDPRPAPVGENRSREAENRSREAENRSREAENRAREAENRARELEIRARDQAYRPFQHDVRIVHVHPTPPRTHRGYWHHGYRDGIFGWWWVVGPTWTYYARPVYPEPPLIVQQTLPTVVLPPVQAVSAPTNAPVTQYWYYCEPAQTYYPYVSTCSVPWTPVPATPADAPR